MDKRTIIAIGLCIGVLVLWTQVFAPKQPPPSPTPPAGQIAPAPTPTAPPTLLPGTPGAAAPDGDAALPSHRRAEVEVILESGVAIRGLVEYDMPESRSRLIDFLNRDDRCIAVRQQGQVRLVNKRHIARVNAMTAPLEAE